MKVTMDYVVGNTAIQIVNTGKKVKIVDVEKQKKKRKFIKQWIIASAQLFPNCSYGKSGSAFE